LAALEMMALVMGAGFVGVGGLEMAVG
jgi:hypothetical protein